MRQLVWISHDTMLAVASGDNWKHDCIIDFTFTIADSEVVIKECHSLQCPGKVVRLFQNRDTNSIFIELEDSTVLKYHHGTVALLSYERTE